MRTIHKFEILPARVNSIRIRGLVRWIHVGVLNDLPAIWALRHTDGPEAVHRLHVVGTGRNLDALMTGDAIYIGTFILEKAGEIYHVFEDADTALLPSTDDRMAALETLALCPVR